MLLLTVVGLSLRVNSQVYTRSASYRLRRETRMDVRIAPEKKGPKRALFWYHYELVYLSKPSHVT